MLAPLAFLLAAQGPDSGDAALTRMAEAMKGRHAVAFTLVGGIKNHEETVRVRLLAPNLYAFEGGGTDERSDGTVAYVINAKERWYRVTRLENELRNLAWLPGYGLVFLNAPKTVATGAARTERLDERDLTAVPVANPPETPADYKATILLDPATNLPAALLIQRSGEPYETYRFRNVQLDPPLTPKDFAYRPPEGYRDANAAIAAPATESVGTKSGPPFLQVPARVGVWTALGNGLDLRLTSPGHALGKDWAFTVEARSADAYDWPKAVVHAEVGPYAAKARSTLFVPQGRHLAIVVPRLPGAVPTGLTLQLPRKDGKAEVVFRFDLRPANGR